MPEQHEQIIISKTQLQQLSNPREQNNHNTAAIAAAVFYNPEHHPVSTTKTDNKPVAIKTKSNKPAANSPFLNSKKDPKTNKNNNNAFADKFKKTANVLARFLLVFFYLSTDAIYCF